MCNAQSIWAWNSKNKKPVEAAEVIHASAFLWHSNTIKLSLQNPCNLEVSGQLPADRELEHTKSEGIAARHRRNAYGQELNSVLLHLNPVPQPQICSLLHVGSTSSGCKAVWPAIPWVDYQNREGISLPTVHAKSCKFGAAYFTLRKT